MFTRGQLFIGSVFLPYWLPTTFPLFHATVLKASLSPLTDYIFLLHKKSYDQLSECFSWHYYISTRAKNKLTLCCAKDNFYGNTVDQGYFSLVFNDTGHSVESAALVNTKKPLESPERRLSPNWRIKHTYYVHGYFKEMYARSLKTLYQFIITVADVAF